MHVRSLGFRTDLELLRLGGSVVEDRGDHVVVRTPRNPSYHWGNFLLLRDAPSPADAQLWLRRFADAFPGAEHVALGLDVTSAAVDLSGFEAAGLCGSAATVMTADAVHEPPRPNLAATYRPLEGDDDWRQWVELRAVANDVYEPASYREFLLAQMATYRQLAGEGHGWWFGAFESGRLLSGLGLFRAGPGLFRFQAVETHPDARRRGLAGTLVHQAGACGLRDPGARALVMVAEPDDTVVRLYRSVGFRDVESQVQLERPPDVGPVLPGSDQAP